jgi:hypothetical protein
MDANKWLLSPAKNAGSDSRSAALVSDLGKGCLEQSGKYDGDERK